MHYLDIEEAKAETGLRLVLTEGVPGPWSETAKAVFNHHKVPFVPVRQRGGGKNPELKAWTGHRNAPVALYNDEAPRVRWQEILDLSERLGSGSSLYPADIEQRVDMVGLSSEIAGENGFAWCARLVMFDAIIEKQGIEAMAKNPMFYDYQYDPEKSAVVLERLRSILDYLATRLRHGGDYLVCDQFTAADLYWAYFSNLLEPQSEEVNPMPSFLRNNYHMAATALGGFDDILIAHRDRMFARHLITPLTF